MPGLNWDGGATLMVEITVTDAATGSPVSGASVDICESTTGAVLPINPPTLTDSRGEAMLRTFAGAGGERNSFYERNSASADIYSARSAATGYVTSSVPLGGVRYGRVLFVPWGSRVLHVTIPMKKTPSTLPVGR
jgi:hypothetical protein